MRLWRRRKREPDVNSREALEDADAKLERARERGEDVAELTQELRRHRDVADQFDRIVIEGYR